MNHLKNESSPYLLQHANNPVDWYSWCEEAFSRAKSEDKPIFLSIGYSTCHWCHVMAHESFENEEIAKMLNDNFISIKVDREERPDIDSVYMSACQGLTGSGGWPMSIFMTWNKKPFFAGTYFPSHSKFGMLGFSDLLNEVIRMWKNDKNNLLKSAEFITERLKTFEEETGKIKSQNIIEETVRIFKYNYDSEFGGFGSAPKFPTPHSLMFLLLYSSVANDKDSLEMAEKTLLGMRKGGIFDQIGYGFSRYSTDRYFLIPHFEKMLYDNALLIITYSFAFSITQNELYIDTAKKTAEYILREMTSIEGAFYCAQDADSDGVEGKYYTFSYDEIIKVLGSEAGQRFAKTFDITERGNFNGTNIPNLLQSNDLKTDFSQEIGILYDYRKSRIKLHLDDKIMLSWNAMMICAFCILYRVTKDKNYLEVAQKAQKFIEEKLTDELELHSNIRDGKRSDKAFLDDYAYYISALIELYNSTLEISYLKLSEELCNKVVAKFYDEKLGGFFLSSKEQSELFINPKETYDGAVPSGNSIMAYNLVRLYQLTENEEYKRLIDKQFEFMLSKSQDNPANSSMFLVAKMILDYEPEHIVIVKSEDFDFSKIIERLPLISNAIIKEQNEEYKLLNGKTTYYVCKNNNCLPPTNELDNLNC